MKLTAQIIRAVLGCTQDKAEAYVSGLNAVALRYQINTRMRMAAFLAQVGHESGRLAYSVENLNYSAEALLRVFPKYFKTNVEAATYARQPARIGSRVYANRMGNGSEASGEGYKYRGRGLIQLTGKNNYVAAGKALNVDLVNNPDYASTPEGACLTAGWFWDTNGLNAMADKGDIIGISKRVNGGTNGLEDRQAIYNKALAALV